MRLGHKQGVIVSSCLRGNLPDGHDHLVTLTNAGPIRG